MGEFFDNWTTQLRKGLLELGILNAIRGGRMYGYDIVRSLHQIEGLVISEGTVYPILSRLKQEGLLSTNLVESAEGPARKYYELTARGRGHLDRMNEYWEQIKLGVEVLAKEKPQ
jgi:PadR family transcriptional regulator PadR